MNSIAISLRLGIDRRNRKVESIASLVRYCVTREKLILSPACVEAISASAATKAGRASTQDSRGAENTVELRRARFHGRSPERSN
jgi:hypothetical protein